MYSFSLQPFVEKKKQLLCEYQHCNIVGYVYDYFLSKSIKMTCYIFQVPKEAVRASSNVADSTTDQLQPGTVLTGNN